MITPKKLLDAYLYDIPDYLTHLKLYGTYTFDDAMSDLENSEIQANGEIEIIDRYYPKLCHEVREKFSDARDTIYELIDEIIDNMSLQDIINSNHWYINPRAYKGRELDKFTKVTKIAKGIIRYNENNELTDNHLQLARQKDKTLFETLFINQN